MGKHKKRVLVLGYFGYQNNQLDGQTIKTRNVYTLLKSKEDSFFKNVLYFDTQIFQKNKLNILKVFKLIFKTDILFYLPAHGNLKFVFPFLFILCKFTNTKIHYIIIGGWLSEYLKQMPIHRWMLSQIRSIYPENRQHLIDLKQKYGFTNLHQLHNFRIHSTSLIKTKEHDEILLVFMARVHPLKGVETIFKLEKEIIHRKIKNVRLDIYGPLFMDFKNDFNKLIEESKIIKYKGILNPEDIYTTLVKYDLMLFPTKYYTEGFPGSILDAYISKVPVIAANWKYANEFIENHVSGVITEFDNEEMFIYETIKLIKSPNILEDLKLGAAIQAKKYSSESAWEILNNKI